jgi:hypothetical protein
MEEFGKEEQSINYHKIEKLEIFSFEIASRNKFKR